MTHQAPSVEEREGLVAGSAHQQGQLLLLLPQPAVLGVGQVSLGPLDCPAINGGSAVGGIVVAQPLTETR